MYTCKGVERTLCPWACLYTCNVGGREGNAEDIVSGVGAGVRAMSTEESKWKDDVSGRAPVNRHVDKTAIELPLYVGYQRGQKK